MWNVLVLQRSSRGALEMRLQLRAQGSVRPRRHAALARLTYALVLRECIAVAALLQLCEHTQRSVRPQGRAALGSAAYTLLIL